MTPPAADPEPPDRPIDYRYTLANERTFLAWIRTSLALLAGSVAVVQFAPDLGSETFRECCGVVLAAFAGCGAVGGLLRWRSNEDAMREGRPLSTIGALPAVVAGGLALVALAVGALLISALL